MQGDKMQIMISRGAIIFCTVFAVVHSHQQGNAKHEKQLPQQLLSVSIQKYPIASHPREPMGYAARPSFGSIYSEAKPLQGAGLRPVQELGAKPVQGTEGSLLQGSGAKPMQESGPPMNLFDYATGQFHGNKAQREMHQHKLKTGSHRRRRRQLLGGLGGGMAGAGASAQAQGTGLGIGGGLMGYPYMGMPFIG